MRLITAGAKCLIRRAWGRTAPGSVQSCDKLGVCAKEAIMPALTLDEQLIFDVALALKNVKIPGFRKGVVEEGRFEIAKTIVSRWEFVKGRLQ